MEILFGIALMSALPVYLVAQVVILFRWRGWARWLTLPPMLLMAAAIVLYFQAEAQGSNLAPLFMFLAAPFCLLWLWVIRMFRTSPANR